MEVVMITSYRSIGVAAAFAASLACAGPAVAGPIVIAGPLAVAASSKNALPLVETVAWRHHYRRHHYGYGGGALVAGAALGIIGLAMANGYTAPA
jgi:hypothetical protein